MSKLENYLIKKYDTLDSTQEEAKRLIDSGQAIEGQVLLAKQQTKAHGKQGKPWKDSGSDIAMTIILKPEVAPNLWGQICYIAAIATAKSIQSLTPNLNMQFKWVNDILINDKKVGGILLEQAKHGFLLIGIGLNLKDSDHLAKFNATSLEAQNITFDYDYLVNDILTNFITSYNLWLDRGFSMVKTQWLRNAKGLNTALTVKLIDKILEGIFIGIDDEDGSLLLVVGSEVKSIPAGDAFFNVE